MGSCYFNVNQFTSHVLRKFFPDGVDWGGHVHPTFLKIIFLTGLNSMKKGWGGGRF